jgi:hypothetical protein
MKTLLTVVIVLVAVLALALAQQPGQGALKETSVKMSGKTITLKYSALPAGGGNISGVPFSFHTDANLEIQGLAVPKGDYTFYLVPDAKEWQLIISKQTGAQAASHNPKMDLGRVPMDMKKASAAADALKMTLASLGNIAGKLDVAWESTIASVPFNIDAIKANAEW